MTQDKAGDRVGGATKRLVVLLLAMVIAGFVIPSPGVSTPDFNASPGHKFLGLSNPGDPELLIVPSIKLKAPVLPIAMVKENGVNTLHPPSDYHEVGWWTGSAKPGSAKGQTLITGHTVHTGGGVMNELGELKPGAPIQVKTKRATINYLTTQVFVYTKDQLSKHADDLFGQDRPDNRLVLVTCTGWTGSYYTSNIIVLATPIGYTTEKTKPDTGAGAQNAAPDASKSS